LAAEAAPAGRRTKRFELCTISHIQANKSGPDWGEPPAGASSIYLIEAPRLFAAGAAAGIAARLTERALD
jgi:hypothetical protein